jgi:hypothetical protein
MIRRKQFTPDEQDAALLIVLTNTFARTYTRETRTNDEVVPIYHVPPVVALGKQFKEKNRAAFFSGKPGSKAVLVMDTVGDEAAEIV